MAVSAYRVVPLLGRLALHGDNIRSDDGKDDGMGYHNALVSTVVRLRILV